MSHSAQTAFLLLAAVGFITVGIWSYTHLDQYAPSVSTSVGRGPQATPSLETLPPPPQETAPVASSVNGVSAERSFPLVDFLLQTLGLST